jgi:cysteine desulfurase
MNELLSLDQHTETNVCRPALERWVASPHTSETNFLFDLVKATEEDQFAFASSHAEAVQQVYWSVFLGCARKEGKCHLLTSCLEDASMLLGLKRLEELGCFVKIVPCDSRGLIDLIALKQLINPRTALFSVSLVQGLTGVIQPMEEVAFLCREQGILLHVDATYAVGKLPLSMREADYLTFAGDRMHSVKSSAALFAKASSPLVPLIPGKSLDLASLAAMNVAAQHAQLSMHLMGLEGARLRQKLERELLLRITGARILFIEELRVPNVTVIAFPVHQELMIAFLKQKGILATIGGVVQAHLHRLLLAAGADERTAVSSVSFALSRMSKEEEVDRVVHACVEICEKQIGDFIGSFSRADAELRAMRLATGHVGGPKEARECTFFWLVDLCDGVIADVKVQAFGPPSFLHALEATCELLMRKHYEQASRLSAELIERHARKKNPSLTIEGSLFNQILDAVDLAVEQCLDLPSAHYVQTPIDEPEQRPGSANWESLSVEQKFAFIEQVIQEDIRPYIELDAGGIQVLEITDSSEVRIAYEGACTSCPSSTGSTLSAIQRILRTRVHPSLTVSL